MSKKHRQAFRELREWCKKHDCWISSKNDNVKFLFDFGEEGQREYHGYNFDKNSSDIIQRSKLILDEMEGGAGGD